MKKCEVVLVIDDDPNIHGLVEFHLEGVVGKVLAAIRGAEGIRTAIQ